VGSIDWLYLFNGFHGRIGRQTFWTGAIPLLVIECLFYLVAKQIEGDGRLSAIVDIAFTYPEFALTLKRVHDLDLPIWLLFIFFGANAVLDLLIVLGFAGTGETPSMLSLAIMVPYLVFVVALIIELGFRRGTVGPNQHGPDPLGAH
jgi:uncharacterized membrane protein YhaH (DUF805 family)